MAEILIVDLKKELEKSMANDEIERILDILKEIKAAEINEKILESTLIGQTVAKLKKHSDENIVIITKDLLNTWRNTLKQASQQKKPAAKQKSNLSLNSPPSQSSQSSQPEEIVTPTPPKPATLKKKEKIEELKTKKEEPHKRAKPAAKPTTTNIDDPRAKVTSMIEEALILTGESEKASVVAKEIEQELFKLYNGVSKDYKAKCRSLFLNLKDEKNPSLRERVICGEISANQLCTMSVQELASKELNEHRKKLADEATKRTMIPKNEATTDQFRCSRCSKRECTYNQLQTRSADEPMTVFVCCMNCGHRWKM